MKIAHLIAQFYPYIGGAEICVHNVCNNLATSGHNAVVVTTTPPPKTKVDLPYEIVHLPSRTCSLLRRLPFLGRILLHRQLAMLQKKHNFDLWQVTMGYPLGIYAVEFFRKNNIPCILRCCGEDIQKYPEIEYGYRLDDRIDLLAMQNYPKFNGHVALTPSVVDEYIPMGIDEKQIRIIPNGVDTSKFSAIRALPKSTLRDELAIANDTKLILTVGRYHPKKGFDLIPAIARKLQASNINFTWVIAGRNCSEVIKKFPQSSELNIVAIEKFADTGGNKFSLPSEELIKLYCASDIFVLPTLIETFGMVLVEAMAAGLPIVTTDAPGVKDVIEHNQNGLKAPVNSVDKIADYIIELFNDKPLAEKLSSNSLQLAKDTYSWDIVTAKYASFYKDTIASFNENCS